MLVKSRVIRAFFGLAVVLAVGLAWFAVRSHPDATVSGDAALNRAAPGAMAVTATTESATRPAGPEEGTDVEGPEGTGGGSGPSPGKTVSRGTGA
jgi:hypothetical protein